MAKRGTVEEIEALREKFKQRGFVVAPDILYGNDRENYTRGFMDAFDLLTPLFDCALKTSDHRLIGHAEPDAYTRLGCLTNVATEAIEAVRRNLRECYNADLNVLRTREEEERKPGEPAPWGAANPAQSKAEADCRANEWADSEMFLEVGLWETLGWTQHETELFADRGTVPEGYGR